MRCLDMVNICRSLAQAIPPLSLPPGQTPVEARTRPRKASIAFLGGIWLQGGKP